MLKKYFAKVSPVEEVEHFLLEKMQIRLLVKRDDLLHEQIAGNKWRKLKYNLQAAEANKVEKILTFGGAYSNHIAATAAAGMLLGFSTIGIIRGEEVAPLNPTLAAARTWGMNLQFVDRETYREMTQGRRLEFLAKLQPDTLFLPEGGTNKLALRGTAEMATELLDQLTLLPDYICVSAGTGGTAAGIISGLKGCGRVLVFPALRGDWMQTEIQTLLAKNGQGALDNWELVANYHFGGYAKANAELVDFINDFHQNHNIPLDPIYTGKLFYGLFAEIAAGRFPPGSTIVAVHSGGLQGIAGFNQRFAHRGWRIE